MFALDVVFGRYALALTKRRATAAASWGALCVVFQGGVILSYVHDPWALLSAAAGAFCGTFVVTRVWSLRWLEDVAWPHYLCEDCFGSLGDAHACQCAAYSAGAPGTPPTRAQRAARVVLTMVLKSACVWHQICARLPAWIACRRS